MRFCPLPRPGRGGEPRAPGKPLDLLVDCVNFRRIQSEDRRYNYSSSSNFNSFGTGSRSASMSIMVFSCDISKREFTEKRSNLWSCHRCSQSFNRRDNNEMHHRVCLFKTTGKRSGGHLDTTAKKLKDNTSWCSQWYHEYCLNLEDEQQDALNVLDVLKESTFQVDNRIYGEVVKKRAVKFYLSLHVIFPLSTGVAFLTDPPAILSTDTIDVYDSSDVHDALNSAYENLVSAIEDFQQCGSGWILDKLVALHLHLLKFDPLRATSYIPLPTCMQNRKAVINIKNKD